MKNVYEWFDIKHKGLIMYMNDWHKSKRFKSYEKLNLAYKWCDIKHKIVWIKSLPQHIKDLIQIICKEYPWAQSSNSTKASENK